MSKKPITVNSIPKEIEIFGRTIKTIFDNQRLNSIDVYGEARYGCNEIHLADSKHDRDYTEEEIKLTFLHEMFHFILNFTGYEEILTRSGFVDMEQFIELMSSAVYQYEKSRKY